MNDYLDLFISYLAVEKGFDIRFTQRELLTFKNVGDLLQSIQSKCG